MPGDASRGLEIPPNFAQVKMIIPPAEISTFDTDSTYLPTQRLLISSATLISLPIPDASMPFNVLTLVVVQTLSNNIC